MTLLTRNGFMDQWRIIRSAMDWYYISKIVNGWMCWQIGMGLGDNGLTCNWQIGMELVMFCRWHGLVSDRRWIPIGTGFALAVGMDWSLFDIGLVLYWHQIGMDWCLIDI